MIMHFQILIKVQPMLGNVKLERLHPALRSPQWRAAVEFSTGLTAATHPVT